MPHRDHGLTQQNELLRKTSGKLKPLIYFLTIFIIYQGPYLKEKKIELRCIATSIKYV